MLNFLFDIIQTAHFILISQYEQAYSLDFEASLLCEDRRWLCGRNVKHHPDSEQAESGLSMKLLDLDHLPAVHAMSDWL